MCVCVFFLSKVPQLGRSFVPERGHPAGWAPENSGFRTRDVTSTKCTIFLVFTETQQSFKFQVLSKEGGKNNQKNPNQQKKTNPNRQTEATTKESPVWKKKNKTNTKKGKKLKLRHSCIAPKTTGNTSTGGVGLGVCTSATVRPGRGSRCSPGTGGSPVRILLNVVVRGRTVEETRVKGLALLPPGEHPGDGAEAHLLFLLFPFLVFQVL